MSFRRKTPYSFVARLSDDRADTYRRATKAVQRSELNLFTIANPTDDESILADRAIAPIRAGTLNPAITAMEGPNIRT